MGSPLPSHLSTIKWSSVRSHGRSDQHRFSVLVSILAQQTEAVSIASPTFSFPLLHRNESQLAQEQLERKNETTTCGIGGSLEKEEILI